MKIAQFSSMEPEPLVVIHDEVRGKYTDLIRISEWVEIEFQKRASDETLPEALKVIDRKIQEVRADNHRRLEALETFRANLLALPAARDTTDTQPEEYLA